MQVQPSHSTPVSATLKLTLSACLIVLVAFLSSSVSGLNIRPDRKQSKYAAYGKQFSAACAIAWDKSKVVREGKGMAGSGTLVAPDWVLTAAHVVDEAAVIGGRLSVLFDKQEIEVIRVVIHPDYPAWPNKEKKVGWPDVALLKLKRPVAKLVPVPLYRGKDEAGQTATIVGFGVVGNFATGAPNGRDAVKQPLVRLAGTNVIEKVWIGDRCLTQVSRLGDATDLEAGILGGDSGGPLLLKENGKWLLAGVVNSSIGGGMGPVHPSYGDNDVFLRVSKYAAWVDATITGE